MLCFKQAVETLRQRRFITPVHDFFKHKPLSRTDKVCISFLIAAVMLSVQEVSDRK